MNEQDIIKNAPEGWTHVEVFIEGVDYKKLIITEGANGAKYSLWSHYDRKDEKWEDCSFDLIGDTFSLRAREDIESIVELKRMVKNLEGSMQVLSEGLDRVEEERDAALTAINEVKRVAEYPPQDKAILKIINEVQS